MDKQCHPILYWACDYSSMLGLKLIHIKHIRKKGPHRSKQSLLIHVLLKYNRTIVFTAVKMVLWNILCIEEILWWITSFYIIDAYALMRRDCEWAFLFNFLERDSPLSSVHHICAQVLVDVEGQLNCADPWRAARGDRESSLTGGGRRHGLDMNRTSSRGGGHLDQLARGGGHWGSTHFSASLLCPYPHWASLKSGLH